MSTPALTEIPTSPAQTHAAGALIEMRGLALKARDGARQLDDLSLYLRPRQLLALTGPDALARKALLRVLSGEILPDKGEVLIDGVNLVKFWNSFQPGIGLVPEVDALQPELTAQEAVESAARLRLPRGTSSRERASQVAETLASLGLESVSKERIHRLSPGMRWRVSIAVELVARPFLLLVEQPEVRLSPEDEVAVARRLKALAQAGMTVLLETTLSAAVLLADQAILLAPGGGLAWFGPPAEALQYFQPQVQDDPALQALPGFEGVSGLLVEPADPPRDWGKQFRSDPAYKQYVDGWMNTKNPDLLLQDQPLARLRQQMGSAEPPAVKPQASFLAQAFFLLARTLRLLFRTRTGWLMLLVPLLAGLTDFLISSPKMNDPFTGDPFWAPAATDFFVLLALLVMALLFSPVIVRARVSLQRERWQSLKSSAFILANALAAAIFAVYAGLAWGVIHFIASGMPGGPLTALEFCITLALLAWVGGLLGLVASAFSNSPQTAAGLAVLFVVPQLIFSGGILPGPSVLPAGQIVSQLVPARHGFNALLTASGYGQAIASDPCWQLDSTQRSGMDESQKQACTCLGSNIFTQCAFAGARRFYTESVDMPEPVEPTPDPGLVLPIQPSLQPGQSAQDYAKAVDAYTLALESYQGSYDSFISSMRQYLLADAAWQRDRSMAIGGAESQLELAVARFGQSFQSSLPGSWLALAAFGIFFVILLGIIQRGKGVRKHV